MEQGGQTSIHPDTNRCRESPVFVFSEQQRPPHLNPRLSRNCLPRTACLSHHHFQPGGRSIRSRGCSQASRKKTAAKPESDPFIATSHTLKKKFVPARGCSGRQTNCARGGGGGGGSLAGISFHGRARLATPGFSGLISRRACLRQMTTGLFHADADYHVRQDPPAFGRARSSISTTTQLCGLARSFDQNLSLGHWRENYPRRRPGGRQGPRHSNGYF